VLLDVQEVAMARKYVDCREIPSQSKCTVAISADSEKELIEVAVQHARLSGSRPSGHSGVPAHVEAGH
jgi:hypothetical protein